MAPLAPLKSAYASKTSIRTEAIICVEDLVKFGHMLADRSRDALSDRQTDRQTDTPHHNTPLPHRWCRSNYYFHTGSGALRGDAALHGTVPYGAALAPDKLHRGDAP